MGYVRHRSESDRQANRAAIAGPDRRLLGTVLDSAISPILDVLGLKLGEADVSVLGLSCPDTGRAPPRLVG